MWSRPAKAVVFTVGLSLVSVSHAETLPIPKPRPVEQQAQTPNVASDADLSCEAALADAGVQFRIADAIVGNEGCGVARPVVIDALADGIVVTPETRLSCPAALSFANWVSDVVVPASRTLGDEVELTGLTNASTYVCRTRNSQAGAKLSEHATGNAIDISAFQFRGHHPLAISPRDNDGSREEAFQKAVWFGACLHFTTVLGPGNDAFHDDHLHMDMAQRRGGYRLCRFPDQQN